MVRELKLIMALALALLAGVIAMSCTPSIDTSNFIGEWEFLYGSSEGLSEEEINMAKGPGSSVVLTLNEDGTGTFDLFGDVSTLTWTATNETEGSVTVEGNNAASMSIEDEQLILSDSHEETLTFSRLANESD